MVLLHMDFMIDLIRPRINNLSVQETYTERKRYRFILLIIKGTYTYRNCKLTETESHLYIYKLKHILIELERTESKQKNYVPLFILQICNRNKRDYRQDKWHKK